MLVHQFFMPLYGGNTLFAVMKNTFFSVAAVLIAAFIGGLSAVGQPLGAALLMYRGFGIGLSAAMIFLELKLSQEFWCLSCPRL